MNDLNNKLNICGCCSDDTSAPNLSNAQGLSSLSYRIGTYGSFKKEMLDAISINNVLSKLTTRYDDDLAIATLDAWATVLDVLTFYQERICNEAYLRTAIERLSVVYLAWQINYKPAPGLSAETYFVFSMSEAQGAPLSAVIQKGTKVQSIPKQDQMPQIFETEEEVIAKVSWNSIKPKAIKIKYPAAGHKKIYLKGTQTGLQSGDKILITADRKYDSTDNNWDFRTINKITTDSSANYTLIELDENIGRSRESTISKVSTTATSPVYKAAPDFPLLNVNLKSDYFRLENLNKTFLNNRITVVENPVNRYSSNTASDETVKVPNTLQSINNSTFKVFALRQKANVFGYNAPDFGVMNAMSGNKLASVSNDAHEPTEWGGFTISANIIYLDALYPKIVKDSWLIMTNSGHTDLFGISNSSESVRNGFTLASKSMKLQLENNPNFPNFEKRIRDTLIYAQSEELLLAELPVIDPLNQKKIILESIIPDLTKGQKIFITGKRWRLEIPAEIDPKSADLDILSLDGSALPLASGISLPIINLPVKPTESTIQYIVRDTAGTRWSITDKYDPLAGSEWQPKNLHIISAGKDDELVSEFHTIDSIVLLSDGDSIQNHMRITLTESIDNYFDLQATTINANVAGGNQGETKKEILGNGDGGQIFQKFQLKQKPLTYISAHNANGAQTTLEIRINNIKWKEVPSFYGTTPKDKIFTTTIADDGSVTICFGDGATGSRLPTGIANVKATYRAGIGLDGLMDAGQLSMLVTPQLGVNKVNNPLAASGAQDPETIDSAKQNAPLTVLTLDRIVSADDYENFARAFAGIGKARADIIWNGEQEIVNITAALTDGTTIKPTDKVYDRLLKALESHGHTNSKIFLAGYNLSPFVIDVSLSVDDNYDFKLVKQNVAIALFETFSFAVMNFGQNITAAEVINIIQQVEGVVYVQLNQLGNQNPFIVDNFKLSPAIPKLNSDGSIQEAELLVIDINNSNINPVLS